ncbi:chemotaxis methyltransferase protein (plasmid) [Cereibacter sphaeroides WS8N]|nr:chemotaxis methyltransferase protein [Cereibacter sphaeroides WS8N]
MAHGTASPDGELYRQFFEAADDGFCLVEMIPAAGGAPADARILAVNAAFARETGVAAVEGGSLRALAPAAAEVWIAALCRIAESGRPETVEVEGPCEVPGFPVGAAAERKVGFRLEDIQARRQAEEAGAAAVWQLRHVLSGMGEAFGILDHDLRILIQNHAALRLDGRTLEEIRGRTHGTSIPTRRTASSAVSTGARWRRGCRSRWSTATNGPTAAPAGSRCGPARCPRALPSSGTTSPSARRQSCPCARARPATAASSTRWTRASSSPGCCATARGAPWTRCFSKAIRWPRG